MKIADVSAYQGNVKWDKAASELDFVILRASVGTSVDTMYKRNASELDRLGIPYHAYHYVKATSKYAAIQEAKVFAKAVENTNPLFYVIDAEYSQIRASEARSIMEEFETALRDSISLGIRVGCYIGHHLYNSWKLDYDRYAYVWVPRYGKDTGEISGSIQPAYPCDLWQYTSKGHLPGIDGNVDLNVINGDKPVSFFTTEEKESEIMIQFGSKGKEVKYIQCALIALGYDLGKYGADGSYGKMTQAAIDKFQSDYGFYQNGVVDDQVYDGIFTALTKIPKSQD